MNFEKLTEKTEETKSNKLDWSWTKPLENMPEVEPEELKISYELHGIKLTVEIPLGDPKEVMDRLVKVANTVDSLRKAYEELKL